MARQVESKKEEVEVQQESQIQVISENQVIISLLEQILEELRAYRLPVEEPKEVKEQ